MGRLKVDDNIDDFRRKNAIVMQGAVEDMSKDIKMLAQTRVPFKSGDLQKSADIEKKEGYRHQVWFNEEYAAVQERGQRLTGIGAPTRMFKNYTTAGTHKKFLSKAAGKVASESLNYFKKAAQLAKV